MYSLPNSVSMKIILAFSMSVLLQYFAFGQNDTLILQPGPLDGIDSHLTDRWPDTTLQIDPEFITYDWTFGGTEHHGLSLIKFDLTLIPNGSTIISAELSLFWGPTASNGQDGINESNLRKVTSPWLENSVTWNTMPTTDTTGQVLLSTSTVHTQDYLDINVLSLIDTSHNYGFMLIHPVMQLYRAMKFCSSDYSDATKRPKMVIIYTPPVDHTSVENIQREFVLSTFPNPSSDDILVSIIPFVENVNIELFNVLGESVFQKQFIAQDKIIISRSDFLSGLYFLVATSSSGYKERIGVVLD